MARKKNLERAIVLGLILSTSIYGSVSAATIDVADFINGKTGTITVTEDLLLLVMAGKMVIVIPLVTAFFRMLME